MSAATAIAALAAAAAAASTHGSSNNRTLDQSSLLSGSNSGNGSRRNHSALLLPTDHLPLQLTTAKVDLEFEIDIQLLTNGYDGTTVSVWAIGDSGGMSMSMSICALSLGIDCTLVYWLAFWFQLTSFMSMSSS